MTRLTDDGVRLAILDRLKAAEGRCNQGHLFHVDGILRGLLWAMTGEDPGTYLTSDVGRILTLAGIPWEEKDGMVTWEWEPAADAGP